MPNCIYRFVFLFFCFFWGEAKRPLSRAPLISSGIILTLINIYKTIQINYIERQLYSLQLNLFVAVVGKVTVDTLSRHQRNTFLKSLMENTLLVSKDYFIFILVLFNCCLKYTREMIVAIVR